MYDSLTKGFQREEREGRVLSRSRLAFWTKSLARPSAASAKMRVHFGCFWTSGLPQLRKLLSLLEACSHQSAKLSPLLHGWARKMRNYPFPTVGLTWSLAV